MPQIKLLPENLINQIAAGEVVERPASVVKELIENSIDADAKRVTVEVNDGGEEFIRITDDGLGMDKEDALMAFERHATSKISTTDDLFRIRSMGFRGEAIASIASVSNILLQTKKRGENEGSLITSIGGRIVKSCTIGCPEGTQIEVKKLFFNTPARRKYLKNSQTEYGHILDVFTSIALAFPQTAFRLVHNEKIVLDLMPTDDDLIRIRELLGRNIADELVPVFYGHSAIQLKGYIGKPMVARSSRSSQYFFVNNRVVKSHVLSYAVKQGFYSLLPKEKHPVFLLYFQIDPTIVDVNVHPRKQEVRFTDEKEIFKIVMQASQKALEKYVLAPKIDDITPENYYQVRAHQTIESETKKPVMPGLRQLVSKQAVVMAGQPVSVQEALNFTAQIAQNEHYHAPIQSQSATAEKGISDTYFIREESLGITPLAQLNNSFILCQQGEELVIIDQHAAHERIRYTEIVRDFEEKKKQIQPLLTPLTLELSYQEVALIRENIELLNNLGFEIEPFGGNTFAINAIPSYMTRQNIENVIMGLIDDISMGLQKGDFLKKKEKALIYMACRSAVMFGDKLSMQEMGKIVSDLEKLESPYTCPHGRPTIITMSHEELLKRFGRKYI